MNELRSLDEKSLRNKKILAKLCKLSDEQVKQIIDSNIVETISKLDVNLINNIFRNSSVIMQNKMWENETIQRMLLLGTNDVNSFRVNSDSIRKVVVFAKVIKSQSIKKNIYKNKYFQLIASYIPENENQFFRAYDINKTFEEIIKSQRFNEADISTQLCVLKYLNYHSSKFLLPEDFIKRYKSIDSLLANNYWKTIEPNILSQLNEKDLFFLDVVANHNNSESIKKYIMKNLTTNMSFEEFYKSIKEQSDLINRRIQNTLQRSCFVRLPSLEKTVIDIILNELKEDELIVEKLFQFIIERVSRINLSVNLENVYNTLKRNYYNNLLTYRNIDILIRNYNLDDMDVRLYFYLKFNIVLNNTSYLNGISLEQLEKINIKHINKLYRILEDKTQDELSSTYGQCIKLYLIFGYERALEILNGKFGAYNSVLLDNVAKTNVTNIKMKQEGNKYLPEIDNRFINFMFETPTHNHFINMLNNKNGELYKRWYYIYNNYEDILEKCHGTITMKKIEEILETEKYDLNLNVIKPDNYKLRDNSFLENIVLGNKSSYSNDEVLKEVVNIYDQMKLRTESSIPYIKGIASNGYSYEMLKFDDKQVFELGYKANCCMRVKDIAHNHLLYSALCRNGRTLLIYNKLGDLVGFCPLKRNGNVLIANSIECIVERKSQNTYTEAGLCLKEAMENIINITTESKEPIDITCIGRNAYAKPVTTPFPENYPTPTIYEKDDKVYCNTDQYHKNLDVICKRDKFKYEDIKCKDPEVSYMDPRDEIKYYNYRENNYDNKEVVDVINSINYTLDKENYNPISKFSINEAYYSNDWYVGLFYGQLQGFYLETDYRAKMEYEEHFNMLKEKLEKRVLKKELK